MNYAIEEYVFNDYNALSKARKDVSCFVQENAFHTLVKNDRSKQRYGFFAKGLKALWVLVKVFTLCKNDVLFVQTSDFLLKLILRIKNIRKFKLIYLIHDIYSLRYNTEISIDKHWMEIQNDIQVLNRCDYVIAHNQFMIDRLVQFGCESKLVSLDIFDYACNFPAKRCLWRKGQKIQIAFAGNISKSLFLKELDKKDFPFHVNVYGNPHVQYHNLDYKGCVDADLLPDVIEGHFGLIWEGSYYADMTDNYNQINNPRKLSMYIVAGLPIIALKGTAAGAFIEKEKIGLTIDSLEQLLDISNALNENEYQSMIDNCLKIRADLVKGMYIQRALHKCV